MLKLILLSELGGCEWQLKGTNHKPVLGASVTVNIALHLSLATQIYI